MAEEQDILIQLIRQLEKDAEMMKAFVKQVTVMSDQSINIEWNFKMDDGIASLLREDKETGQREGLPGNIKKNWRYRKWTERSEVT